MSRSATLDRLKSQIPVIAPSMLKCDFGNLHREIELLDNADAGILHLDVMDGHFVPNLSYGPMVIERLRPMTRDVFDAHLMISEPDRYLDEYLKAGCDAKALVVTSFGDRETVVSAVRAGADGYLLKDSSAAVILDGIEVTLEGGAPISSAAAVYLLDRLRNAPEIEVAAPENSGLTPREVELLELFAKGESYKDAARTLGISPLTVGNHVKSIYRKLAVHSRGEAVYEAIKTGQLSI